MKVFSITILSSHKILSRGGDVPSYALDAKVDLRYFPDAVAEKDVAHKKRVSLIPRL